MSKLNLFITSLLLTTTPSMLVYPQATFQEQKVNREEIRARKDYTLSYDAMLRLFDEIESGELENKCTLEELEKIEHFVAFLAKEGVLPDNSEESLSLDDDIEELLNGEGGLYESAVAFVTPDDYQYMIFPTVLHDRRELILCKSWVQKRWKHVKHFTKKHKKALIIGAAIAVAATVIIVAVVAAAGAIASSDSDKKKQKEESSPASSVPADILPGIAATHEAPTLKSVIDNQISSFKENIVQNHFFQSTNPTTQNQGLSWEENGRALGSLFAHDSYNKLLHQIPNHPGLAQEVQDINLKYTFSIPGGNNGASIGHPEIDRKFSTDFTYLYANPEQEVDFNTLSYQVRGESALDHGHYVQAIQDFGKAIELNPTNPIPYLKKGVANFSLGKYDHSLADYQQFTSQVQKTHPIPVPDFSLGFAKGLPKGIYESGRGILMFVSDVVVHPIHTGQQMFEAFTFLSNLARSGEWSILGEVLAPEIHQLINEWDTISPDKRGELAGYAFGKHGADILIPGALAKATAKGLKGAQELSTVYRGLKTAEQTFLLESAAGLENSTKIAEIVHLEKQISNWLGEGAKFIRNEAGDPVFLSKDGLRCVRFDFNKTKPHNNPHAHIEIKVDGKWVKSEQIYPRDLPHN